MSKVNLVNVDTHNERVIKTYSYHMEFFTNMCVFTNYSDVEKLSEDLGIWVPEKIQFVFALRREGYFDIDVLGHFFLVERVEKEAASHTRCYGICSCGHYDWWWKRILISVPQTDELKQLFANLLLQQ